MVFLWKQQPAQAPDSHINLQPVLRMATRDRARLRMTLYLGFASNAVVAAPAASPSEAARKVRRSTFTNVLRRHSARWHK